MGQPYQPTQSTTSAVQYLLSTYYDKNLLEQLKQQVQLYPLGQVKPLPKNAGAVVKWSRYSLMGEVDELTEGTAPTAQALSAVNVTATLTQLGGYTVTTDLVEMTAIDNQVLSALQQLSYQAALSIDRYALRTILGITGADNSSTDVFIPEASTQVTRNGLLMKYFGTATTISAIGTANTMDIAEVEDAVAYLKTLNAPPMADGKYVAVAHPKLIQQIRTDATAVVSWSDWQRNTAGGQEKMYNGEVGDIAGVRFVESTHTFFHSSGAGAGASAHYMPIIGRAAFGVVDFDGGIKTYVKTPNENDSSNPLNQWSTVGWKWTGACRVLNPSGGLILVVGA